MAELNSVDVLLGQAQVEREARGRLYEGIQTRAEVVLGFAGVVATLARGTSALLVTGRALAAAAGLAALWALLPRLRTDLEIRDYRDRYGAAEAGFTKVALLDGLIGAWEQLRVAAQIAAVRLRSPSPCWLRACSSR